MANEYEFFPQQILNWVFDEEKKALKAEEKETSPTDPSKNNASFTYSYSGGNLTQIDMTIGGVTYRKTFTWTGSDLTSESAWTQI